MIQRSPVSLVTARRATLVAAAFAFLAPSLASATDYYWRGNGGTHYWTNASLWKSQEDGGGTSPSSISASDDFIQTGVTGPMGTAVATTGTATFAGNSLTLTGGQISVKGTGTGVARVVNFITAGNGLIVAAEATNVVHNFHVDNFENQSGETRLSASSNANGRTLNLTIGTLTGAGGFTIDSGSGTGRPVQISVTDASAYTGAFNFGNGSIDFNSDIASGGSLSLSGSAVLTLDQNLSFTAVTINGVSLGAGLHSFAELDAAFDSFFAAGGAGSITVSAIPEPSTYAIVAGTLFLGFAIWRRRSS